MWDWIAKLAELRELNQLAILITVTKSNGSTPREHGAKMIVLPDGSFYGTIGGGVIEQFALTEAIQCFKEMRAASTLFTLKQPKTLPACGGTMELYLEPINNNPSLYLFGAGHVGQAVCQVMEGTPFKIHVVDERKEWIESEKMPNSTIRHPISWQDFIKQMQWEEQKTYVAIMSHHAEVDQEILSAVLNHPARYIGMIGSRAKWKTIQQNLTGKEFDFTRVKCPIGIDIGGKSPKEIAISIAAELLSTFYEKQRSSSMKQI